MRYLSVCASILGIAFMLIVSAGTAHAQATRTWVSGVGDDANPCSRTAPCKTFPGAISKTAANGEIDCLDPGGFGGVTITKSITIDCQTTEGGVLVGGTNGITINAAGIVVTLRGLSIDGAGSGVNGVAFINGSVLNIENCRIFGFNSAGSGLGVNFTAPNGVTASLFMSNTVVMSNGTGTTGGGILVNAAGNGVAKVNLNGVQMLGNVFGFKADGTSSTGTLQVAVNNSVSSGNTYAGFTSFSPNGGATVHLMLMNSVSSNNGTIGLNVSGPTAILRVGMSTVTGNGTAVAIGNSGTGTSFGTNQIFDNTNPGATLTPENPN
jgi:hypothetical protein